MRLINRISADDVFWAFADVLWEWIMSRVSIQSLTAYGVIKLNTEFLIVILTMTLWVWFIHSLTSYWIRHRIYLTDNIITNRIIIASTYKEMLLNLLCWYWLLDLKCSNASVLSTLWSNILEQYVTRFNMLLIKAIWCCVCVFGWKCRRN